MNDNFGVEKFGFEYTGYENDVWATMIQGEGLRWSEVYCKFMDFMKAVYGYDVESHVREMHIRDYLDRKGEK